MEIRIFEKNEFGSIRTVLKNGEIFFVANDVAVALGYETPAKTIVTKVDCAYKGVSKMETPGGNQNVTTINEAGVYQLIFSSKLQGADKFRKWVFEEILPSIRKNGAYMTESTLEKAIANPDFLIQLATQLKHEQQGRLEAERQLQEASPKVQYHDKVLSSKSTYTTTQIAKDLGMSGMRLNSLLESAGIQYKTRDQWVLTYKYQDKGYTKTSTYAYQDTSGETRSKMLTEWTEAGRKFIMDRMQNTQKDE